jgi:hypothetical protein
VRAPARLCAAIVTVLAAAVVTAPAASSKGGDAGGSGSEFFLTNSFTGVADISIRFGHPDGGVFVGDFDGRGADSIAVRLGNEIAVTTENAYRPNYITMYYGRADDEVFVGDWNGDGVDTFAVRRGNTIYFRNSVSSGPADYVVNYGRAGDEVVVGDWNGDGIDSIAVRRGNAYYLQNTMRSGVAEQVVLYGRADDSVIVGDWNGDGVDGLGVRRGNAYHLRNSLSAGAAERVVTYGNSTDTIIVGDWNADGVDTLGVRRDTRVTTPAPPSRDDDRESVGWQGDQVVATARSYIGSPYVWGGRTPSGWDCVGFAGYVYAQYGVTLPRSTYWSEYARYQQVPASQARPGDLIWWPGHVGIYTGNGQNVAAWNPSMGTVERPVSWVSSPNGPTYLRVLPG